MKEKLSSRDLRSANSFDQLERRLKKDEREISVNELIDLSVGMFSSIHRCDRHCCDEAMRCVDKQYK